MTFKQIIDDAAERLGNNQPEARVRFRRYLNEWYHRILADATLPRGVLSTALAITAADGTYTLPTTVSRVRQIYDPTHNIVLEERPLLWIRQADPMNTMQGTPQYYAYVTASDIVLYPIPSASGTLYVDHDAVVTEMDDDADIPTIPDDFHYLLSLGIRINEFEKNQDDRLKYSMDEMISGVARLRYYVASRTMNVSNPAYYQGSGRPYSRFGAWFPRG